MDLQIQLLGINDFFFNKKIKILQYFIIQNYKKIPKSILIQLIQKGKWGFAKRKIHGPLEFF
jgi:hypothetical protein